MNKPILLLGLGVALMCHSQPADASAFVILTSGVTTINCDPSTAAGVINCTSGGFVTALGSNVITFSGLFDGYSIGSLTVSANAPGDGSGASLSDTIVGLSAFSAAFPLTVDFGATDFTSPANLGPLVFTACIKTKWTVSVPGNTHGLTGWTKSDDTKPIPGTGAPPGGSTKGPITHVSPGGPSNPPDSCVSAPDFSRLPSPFSITGRQVINLSTLGPTGDEALVVGGGSGDFTATETVTAVPVPEPASLLLLGTGLAGLASRRRLHKQRQP